MAGYRRNDRIAVSLDPETKAAVTRLALAKGVARSRVIADFLSELRPQILQLAEIMQRVKSDPAEALRRLDSFADTAVDELAQVRADSREAERERSAGTARRGCKFWVEDLASGRAWKPGLTWTDEAADRALAQARKSDPAREWILREVG